MSRFLPLRVIVVAFVATAPVTFATEGVTVTVVLAERFTVPHVKAEVIVAVPSATPVTTPLSSTVATAVLSDVYVIFAVEGLAVAFKATVSRASTVAVFGALIEDFFTVILQE